MSCGRGEDVTGRGGMCSSFPEAGPSPHQEARRLSSTGSIGGRGGEPSNASSNSSYYSAVGYPFCVENTRGAYGGSGDNYFNFYGRETTLNVYMNGPAPTLPNHGYAFGPVHHHYSHNRRRCQYRGGAGGGHGQQLGPPTPVHFDMDHAYDHTYADVHLAALGFPPVNGNGVELRSPSSSSSMQDLAQFGPQMAGQEVQTSGQQLQFPSAGQMAAVSSSSPQLPQQLTANGLSVPFEPTNGQSQGNGGYSFGMRLPSPEPDQVSSGFSSGGSVTSGRRRGRPRRSQSRLDGMGDPSNNTY